MTLAIRIASRDLQLIWPRTSYPNDPGGVRGTSEHRGRHDCSLCVAPTRIIPLASVLLFSTFVAIGLAYRRRPAAHKRLMALFVAAVAIHDRRTLGRLQPMTLWGGLLLIASFPGRLAIGNTDLWLTFAAWLTR